MIVLSPVDTVKKEPIKLDMQKFKEASDRAMKRAFEITKDDFKLLNIKCIVPKRTTK